LITTGQPEASAGPEDAGGLLSRKCAALDESVAENRKLSAGYGGKDLLDDLVNVGIAATLRR